MAWAEERNRQQERNRQHQRTLSQDEGARHAMAATRAAPSQEQNSVAFLMASLNDPGCTPLQRHGGCKALIATLEG